MSNVFASVLGGSGNFSSVFEDTFPNEKTFLKSSSHFEVSESDQLPGKKHFSYKINSGLYQISLDSLSSGKIKVAIEVQSNNKERIYYKERVLSGKGKTNAHFNDHFSLSKNQELGHFNLTLQNKSNIFQKSSYYFKLFRTDEDPNETLSSLLKSVKDKKKKLKEKKDEEQQNSNSNSNSFSTVNSNSTTPSHNNNNNNNNNNNSEFGRLVTSGYSTNNNNTPNNNNYFNSPQTPSSLNSSFNNNQNNNNRIMGRSKSQEFIHNNNINNPNTPSTPSQSSNSSFNKSFTPKKEKKVKNWEKSKVIGSGAFGTVYLGFNQDTGKLMAIKQLNVAQLASKEAKDLENEIDLMSKLDHPHLVRYLGTQRDKNYVYIFLDYIPGGSVESYLKKFQLKENVIKKYIYQVLLGLNYLHHNNIIHRDIKPANILLDENGVVYLADFGCSKKINQLNLKQKKTVTGTPNYMAPEVIEHSGYTFSADIWSLGCTLLEMFTKEPPWAHEMNKFDNPFQFLYWMLNNKEKKLNIPESITSKFARDFIQRCLNVEPVLRPTVNELLNHPWMRSLFEDVNGNEEVNSYNNNNNCNNTNTNNNNVDNLNNNGEINHQNNENKIQEENNNNNDNDEEEDEDSSEEDDDQFDFDDIPDEFDESLEQSTKVVSFDVDNNNNNNFMDNNNGFKDSNFEEKQKNFDTICTEVRRPQKPNSSIVVNAKYETITGTREIKQNQIKQNQNKQNHNIQNNQNIKNNNKKKLENKKVEVKEKNEINFTDYYGGGMHLTSMATFIKKSSKKKVK